MTELNLANIQGFILNGYHMDAVHYFVLEVQNPPAAKKFLQKISTGDLADGPQISNAIIWSQKPDYCLNVGITMDGLRALGLPEESLDSFAKEFQEGAAKRASIIGDTDEHSPENWRGGLGKGEDHVILLLHTKRDQILEEATAELRAHFAVDNAFRELHCFTGHTLPGPKGKVHFGYVDDIGQPRYKGDPIPDAPDGGQEEIDAWHFILEHASGCPYPVPQPDVLGIDGSYMVFRIMEQDCAAFEKLLNDNQSQIEKELLAAKMLGRWRNGDPLILSPEYLADLSEENRNDYLYNSLDRKGEICPIGSHSRRTNPRDQKVRGLTPYHRMMRRGMPYGSEFDPANPDDGIERGLIGVFIGSSIENQFEFILSEWVNRSDFTGGLAKDEVDPIIGHQVSGNFRIRMRDGSTVTVENMPQLVYTRGTSYCFLPSIASLQYIAGM